MLILHFFRWLNHTHFSFFMRNSRWGFAIVEMAHLLGLATLGGSVLLVDLRLLGIGLRRQPVSRIARGLAPVVLAGLGVIVASGLLLMAAFPLKYYYSPAFRLKMVLLVLAVSLHFLLQHHVKKLNDSDTPILWAKVAAVFSLALWFSVGLAGRAIGFL